VDRTSRVGPIAYSAVSETAAVCRLCRDERLGIALDRPTAGRRAFEYRPLVDESDRGIEAVTGLEFEPCASSRWYYRGLERSPTAVGYVTRFLCRSLWDQVTLLEKELV